MATRPVPKRARRGNARPAGREDDVGLRLRAHREQSQLSLRELARRLGISRSRLQRLLEEGGAPEVSEDDTDADTN